MMMGQMIHQILRRGKEWRDGHDGVALMEAALIFPTLFFMLFGVYDVGHAITTNHKLITSVNVIADLMTRGEVVTDAEYYDAVDAGRLAMIPYVRDGDTFQIYVASVRFAANGDPQIVWDESSGAMPTDNNAVERSRGLGAAGEGVIVVSAIYDYEPTFGSIVIDHFRMREIAYARGRRTSVVARE